MSTKPIGASILVVDDEIAYCDAAAEILRAYGYSVHQAYDARVAGQVLRDVRPDVILMDIMMPEIDGLTFLREISSLPSLLGIRLVTVSGMTSPADRSHALMAGADAFLAKPYTTKQLLSVIEYVLGRRPPQTSPLPPPFALRPAAVRS